MNAIGTIYVRCGITEATMLPEIGCNCKVQTLRMYSTVILQYAGINEPKWVSLQDFLNM